MRAAAYRYCIFFFSSPRARKGKEGHTRKIIVMFRSGSAFSFHTGSARTLIKQIWIRNTDSSRVGTRKYCSRKELNTAGAVLGYLQINSRLARYLLEVVVLAALVNLREVSVIPPPTSNLLQDSRHYPLSLSQPEHISHGKNSTQKIFY